MVSITFFTSVVCALAFVFELTFIASVESSPRPIGGPRAPLRRRALRSFTSDELVARYELMVQYKYGNISSCPVVWHYSGSPDMNNGTVLLEHRDISISATNETLPDICDDNPEDGNTLELLSSSRLTDFKLDSFEASIADNIDKTTVFDSLHAQLTGRLYLLSAGKTPGPIRCRGTTWFDNEELFIFFDEDYTVMLSLVSKIQNGGPRILTLPLIGRIRYMLSVSTGSTCIYRVQSDVREVLMNPSDSPAVTPTVPPEAGTILKPAPSLSQAAIPSETASAPSTTTSLSDTSNPTVLIPLPDSTAIISTSATPTPAETPQALPPTLTTIPTTSESATVMSIAPTSSTATSASAAASASAATSASISALVSTSTLASALASAFASILASTSASASTATSPAPTISVLPQIESPSPSMSASVSMSSLPLPSSSPSASPNTTAPTFDQSESPIVDPTNEPQTPDVSGDASRDAETGEGEEDIDTSHKPRGPDVKGAQTCFPASARVTLENGHSLTMAELRIGDRVYVGAGRFSPVILFTHRDATVRTMFVVAHTAHGAILRATPGHFVYVNGRLKPMREISVGDHLIVEGPLSDVVSNGDKVVKVSTAWDTGIYNPQTQVGDIVVDRVKASCYTEAVRVEAAHALLIPFRAIAGIVSSSILDLCSAQVERNSNHFLR